MAESEEPQTGLFRTEALEQQQDRWLGSVLLLPRLSHSVFTIIAMIFALLVVGVIVFGEYTRKVRLSGRLTPEKGLVQVVSPQAGIFLQVLAKEGMQVRKGDVLAILSAERTSETLGATQGEVLRALHSRRNSLLTEKESHAELSQQLAVTHESRLTVIEAELESFEAEIALQGERLKLAQRAASRQKELRDRGLATEGEMLNAQQSEVDQALSLQSIHRNRAAVLRSRVDLIAEIAERPLREKVQLAELDRAIFQIEQELAEAEAAREAVVLAPLDGLITASRISAGEGTGASEPLMTLIPDNSVLEARLYGTSRDIGFVRPGQVVQLRYDAYPHQKFGQYIGKVRSVSRSTVSAEELARYGSPVDAASGVISGEAVYRIIVDLDVQKARAYGQDVDLQSGMTLQADVQIEKRHIWQWLMDPLYSLTGVSSDL